MCVRLESGTSEYNHRTLKRKMSSIMHITVFQSSPFHLRVDIVDATGQRNTEYFSGRGENMDSRGLWGM